MSAGIYSDAGFIFQRKVILYRILAFILKRRFIDCTIELKLRTQRNGKEVIVYLDFVLKERNDLKGGTPEITAHFTEIKSGNSFSKKEHVTEQLQIFFSWFKTASNLNESSRFTLVHSCEKSALKKLYNQECREKLIHEFCPESDRAQFCKSVTSPFYIPETQSTDLIRDDLELRSIMIIDKMLESIGVDRSPIALAVYDGMRLYLENFIHNQSKILKESIFTRVPQDRREFRIDLYDLLNADGSLVPRVIKHQKMSKREVLNLVRTEFALEDSLIGM